jgi:drug/metabolite transporter (DMT)-like permease
MTAFSMLILVFCVLPVVLINRKYLIPRRQVPFFIIYGLIGACAEIAEFWGLFVRVPVAVVAFLLYTQPIWTVFLSRLLLKEPMSYRKTFATVLAMSGVAVLLHASWSGMLDATALGLTAALFGGVCFAFWVIWGRQSGLNNLHFVTTTFGWSSFTFMWLLVFWQLARWFGANSSIVRLSPHFGAANWFPLLVFTIFAGLIPSAAMFRGLQRVDAGIAGVVLLFEPIGASLLGWALFGQQLGSATIAGGLLILAANYFVAGELVEQTAF